MHIKDPKPITDDTINAFLSSSKKPIVYMSLGSMVKSSQMSESVVENFKTAFASLSGEFDVMWKWEKDEMERKPSNVLTRKWFPQADLLAHDRVKVFITQGGEEMAVVGFKWVKLPSKV
jgi:glucuronosyltransferase